MDSWPLSVQWMLWLSIGGVFLGCSWWLTLARARADGAEPATWGEKARTFVGALRFADWALLALLVVFLIPLATRTIAAT